LSWNVKGVLVVAAVIVISGATPAGAVSVSTGRDRSVEGIALRTLNDDRRARGLRTLTLHAGLRDVAREHSRDMAARRRVGHWGFESRLQRATPDPQQSRTGADEGIWGVGVAACENALYRFRAGSTEESDQQVARALVAQWRASAPHARCMFNGGLNAAGLGVYRDAGGVWWATLEVARDATPPAGRCAVDAASASANVCT
jgi:uncharacterized protein YkwD